MERKLITTGDGSASVSIPELNVTYHSIHGAIQESMHVFIEAGLKAVQSPNNILEIGFGTGLNALLTLIEAEKSNQKLNYAALEPFPLEKEEFGALNYCGQLNRADLLDTFLKLHECDWAKPKTITPFFTIQKFKSGLQDFSFPGRFDLIYFDAFAPAAQPELWTTEIFKKLSAMMSPGGILVTYCSKSDVRRSMLEAGFSVEKIPGPKRKREMLRAHANS